MPRLSRAFFPVTALGPGRRLGLWFQGCSIGCLGCLSRDTWDAAGGTDVPIERLREVWRAARERGATGLTVSGGEPAEQPGALVDLLATVRAEGGTADVLVYTGYERDEFAHRAPGALDLLDALITGRYEARQPTDLIWRGSANQQLHLVTALGRERFGEHVEHRPAAPPLQVVVDDRTIWYVGVPRAGDLARMERDLRRSGVHLGASSWRP